MEAKCLAIKWLVGILLFYVITFGVAQGVESTLVRSFDIPKLRYEQ